MNFSTLKSFCKKRFAAAAYSTSFYMLMLLAGLPLCVHASPGHSDSTQRAEPIASASLPYESADGKADNHPHRAVHPLIGLDFRQTWIGLPGNANIPVRMWGIRAGVSINERHRLGLGYAWMHHADLTTNEGSPLNVNYHAFSAFYEYYFLHNHHWSMGAPVEVGIGNYKVHALDPKLDGKSANVTLAGIGLDLHYRPINWLSFNAVGGYRFASNSGPVDLSNWFFSIGFSVPLGHLARDIRDHHKQHKSLSCKQ